MPSMLGSSLSVRAVAMELLLEMSSFNFSSSSSNWSQHPKKLEKWNRRGNLS